MTKPNLIYTFDESILSSESTIAFYDRSIELSRKLGYTTELYTNSNKINSKVDKYHYFNESYILSDYTKHIPLKREDNIVLIDGDVLLHAPIEFSDADLYIDTYESWSSIYEEPAYTLTSLGIIRVIPEWINIKQRVMNTGILKFNNHSFQKLYLDRWTKAYNFVANNKAIDNTFIYTPLLAQYLLTILANHYNITTHSFSKYPREYNKYYQHFCGSEKKKSSLTPSII